LFGSCITLEQDLEWEDVKSDHDPVLNIMGIISSDTLVESFVRVHRSLTMDEARDSLVRDTIDGVQYLYYTPRFVIRNANVVVSNQVNSYTLEYQNFDLEDFDFEEPELQVGAYIYKGDGMNPQPGELWTLSITTPDGKSVTGETTLPPKPVINDGALPDTFNINSVITMKFFSLEDNVQIINIGNLLSYFGPYYYEYDSQDNCGLTQEHLIWQGVDSLVYQKELCGDEDSDWAEDLLIIHMLSMDQNYYEYFIKYGEDPEFSNLLIGSGGSGGGFGLDGGIGFFGSIGIDRAFIPVLP
jgi:hypothetical protein